MIRLCDRLALPRGVIAVVGGGGKTSLIARLARELDGRVLWTTTTRIWPPDCRRVTPATESELFSAWGSARLLAAGSPCADGKWAACPFALTARLADTVLAEADGSRGLPVKAPGEHEPVLPEASAAVIAVAGLSALGRPISEAAHRPERYAALCGCAQDAPVTPEVMARALQSEQGQRKGVRCRYITVLNQADTPPLRAAAREVAALLAGETQIVSLRNDPDFVETWRDGRCLY